MSYAPPRSGLSADQALDQLEALYDAAVDALRQAVSDFISHGTLPDEQARAAGLFVYPELRVSWDGQQSGPNKTRAFGRFTHPGSYSTTVTRPQLFRHYLAEQLAMLEHDYAAHIEVAPSQQEIPFPYVIDGSSLALDRSMSAGIAQHFPTTELAQIGDETADGLYHTTDNHFPLSHFDALRADFSLARLRHYTGTPVEHFQPFVLFTNYTRYVDEFVRWACAQIADPASPYIALSSAGGTYITPETSAPEQAVSDLAWKNHQMPAYHLISRTGQGITLINIGVGPSNAKTICDHLAVLRPRRSAITCWPTPICATITCWMRCCRRISRSRASPRCSAPCTTPPRWSAACPVKRSNSVCAPAPWSPPTIATGSCATPLRRGASTSAARWRSIWRAPPSPPRVTASGCRTARCCASPTNRCTVK
jgi:AMP nucleosidase